MLTAASIVQLPAPLLSNVTTSAAPGTLAPGAPPETFDQLATLFQLDAAAAIQKRLAALAEKAELINNTRNIFADTDFMGYWVSMQLT
jgi:hypothetical protein